MGDASVVGYITHVSLSDVSLSEHEKHARLDKEGALNKM
jgi:hypothetical protein